jgi:hypothetical protein
MVAMNSIALLARTKGTVSRLSPRRWLGSRQTPRYMASSLNSGLSRIEVRPPSLRHAPTPLVQRLLFWLIAPSPQEASPPLNRLPGVQREFRMALADIAGESREVLIDRIGRARSLRELWHMRLDVYNLIALERSEFEAAQRLTQLNRHFPTRASRHPALGVTA